MSTCLLKPRLRIHTISVIGTGRAGLEGADDIVARLRQEASLLRERAAEARSRLQSTHVS